MDWKIRKTILIIVFSFCSLIVGAQKKEEVYFYFDQQSTKKYWRAVRMRRDGKMSKQVPVYRKFKDKKGKIHFTIYGLSFIHDKKMEKAIKSIDFLKNHKVLSANQVKEFMEKKTDPKQNGGYAPFGYPEEEKGFPKLYIAEKKDSARVVLYKVRWQYYIE